MNRTAVEDLHRACTERLLASRGPRGEWRGQLSPSALSTAVAAVALHRTGADGCRQAASRGAAWLTRTILPDGGWGDTPLSGGNLSTSLLALAALRDQRDADSARAATRAEEWLCQRLGGLDAERLAAAVLAHYGDDRTFSVPILTLCALAGLLGEEPGCWQRIPQLPFELAALPRASFALFGLPVVSYALPALIAMGLVRFRRGPRPALPWRALFVSAAHHRLACIQPANGGFLEAVPLTGFVALSLQAAGEGQGSVATRAVGFLRQAQRADGSWPIDTDLATWVTTLAVQSLGEDLPADRRAALLEWLLPQQYHRTHPYTGAAPGGWAWTDLPGGVPDADDTAGALLALHRLAPGEPRVQAAAAAGLAWLLDLANRDGGIPTFCHGWGRLPFDRSCPDLTAHALRAFVRWEPAVARDLRRRLHLAVGDGLRYLRAAQRADGSWVPLWFGNEAAPGHANPVYGTARVLRALAEVLPAAAASRPEWVESAVAWLIAAQRPDGGWGGDRGVEPSVEETALAVSALAHWPNGRGAAARGVDWLVQRPERLDQPAPIGLYFASLWYYEQLYPLVFATEALRTWLASTR